MPNGNSTALMNALAGSMQNAPTTWDWQEGAASPFGIRTPWLGYSWHYDEQGRIVPNDPNRLDAPWNMPGAIQTYEQWLAYQQPSSMYGASQQASAPKTGQTYGTQRSPLEEALRRLQGGMKSWQR